VPVLNSIASLHISNYIALYIIKLNPSKKSEMQNKFFWKLLIMPSLCFLLGCKTNEVHPKVLKIPVQGKDYEERIDYGNRIVFKVKNETLSQGAVRILNRAIAKGRGEHKVSDSKSRIADGQTIVGTSRITLTKATKTIFYSFALTKGRTAGEYDFDNMIVQDLKDSLNVYRIRHKPTPSWILLEDPEAPFEGKLVLIDWDGEEIDLCGRREEPVSLRRGFYSLTPPCDPELVKYIEQGKYTLVSGKKIAYNHPAIVKIPASSP
jgi:hypothetical protein